MHVFIVIDKYSLVLQDNVHAKFVFGVLEIWVKHSFFFLKKKIILNSLKIKNYALRRYALNTICSIKIYTFYIS